MTSRFDATVPRGFTLLELILSMSIGVSVLVGLVAVVGTSRRYYQKVSSEEDGQVAIRNAEQVLQNDLERYLPNLPFSIGHGATDQGWDYLSGHTLPWRRGLTYEDLFPSQQGLTPSSDRLGFYISVSEEEGERYGGLMTAHVLYFTAITSQAKVENLAPPLSAQARGYSKKLYRLFTPPDQVFQRLQAIQDTTELTQGLEAIPREVSLESSVPSSFTVSVVLDFLESFTIQISGHHIDFNDSFRKTYYTDLTNQSGRLQVQAVLKDCEFTFDRKSIEDSVDTLHDLLEAATWSPSQWNVMGYEDLLRPSDLTVMLRCFTQKVGRTMSVGEWKDSSLRNSKAKQHQFHYVFDL